MFKISLLKYLILYKKYGGKMKIYKLFALMFAALLIALPASAKYKFSVLTQVDTSNTFW